MDMWWEAMDLLKQIFEVCSVPPVWLIPNGQV